MVKMGRLFSRRVHAAQKRPQSQRRVDAAAKRFGGDRHNPFLRPPVRTAFPLGAFPATMGAMSRTERHPLITGTVVTSLGTLASRLLGLLRDMATSCAVRSGRQRGCRRLFVRLPHPQSFPPIVRRRGPDGQLSAGADGPPGKRSACGPALVERRGDAAGRAAGGAGGGGRVAARADLARLGRLAAGRICSWGCRRSCCPTWC